MLNKFTVNKNYLPLFPPVLVSVQTAAVFSEGRNIQSVWLHPETSVYTDQPLKCMTRKINVLMHLQVKPLFYMQWSISRFWAILLL